MTVSIEKLDKVKAELTITVPAEEFVAATKKAYKENVSRIKVDGFRQGKAPMAVIEKMYGPEVFFEDAILEGFNKHYNAILDADKSIEPIDSPDIRVEKLDDKGIVIVAEIPVKPEVKLGAYTGLKVSVEPKEITDKDVEKELKQAQLQNARLVEKDGEIAKGDTANIEITYAKQKRWITMFPKRYEVKTIITLPAID